MRIVLILSGLNGLNVKFDDVKMRRQEANRSILLRAINIRGVQEIFLYI